MSADRSVQARRPSAASSHRRRFVLVLLLVLVLVLGLSPSSSTGSVTNLSPVRKLPLVAATVRRSPALHRGRSCCCSSGRCATGGAGPPARASGSSAPAAAVNSRPGVRGRLPFDSSR